MLCNKAVISNNCFTQRRMWTELVHTGPLQRECVDVKKRLFECYKKHRHKYKSSDVFHTNFKTSFSKISSKHRIKGDDTEFSCRMDKTDVVIPNPYLESPCVFVGNHPLRGTCKKGVTKQDVVVNVSSHVIPFLKKKGFSKFVHKPDVNWFASWNDEVTNELKYLFVPYDHDPHKFEKARALKSKLPKIRKAIGELVQSSSLKDIQLGLATHFIERLCIRIGNEKEYDTVGVCTLRSDNIEVGQNGKVRFAFRGKDNIPYDRTVIMNPYFVDAIKKCKALAKEHNNHQLLSDITPNIVNRYLRNFQKDITAKVFRTCKASLLFEKEFRKSNNKNKALLKVAELLNHKRLDPKSNKYVYNLSTSWNNYIDHRIYKDPGFTF